MAMDDLVVQALGKLVPGGVRWGELPRDHRVLRWVEAGSGRPAVVLDAALGEPGSLAWAGVMPLVAPLARVLAYDRAGIGASDPVSPLTLAAQIDDLAAVARQAGGHCVLAGHSWGALLAQLVALRHPELVAGLVLVDPADEQFLAALTPEEYRQEIDSATAVLDQYESGTLPDTIRDTFRSFAQHLTADQQVQALILDAYVSCYVRPSQARMVGQEKRLVFESLPVVHQSRAAGTLPDVPVVIFSATTGRSKEQRELWTGFHADLAASVAQGRHVVLPRTSHATNQERGPEIAEAINSIIEQVRRQDAPAGLVHVEAPVVRHPAGRTGHRLVSRVALRRR
jgi:pimeloyl-ACP methyl ester carboxylesterase